MKPALLADENIPQTVVSGLRAAGFDVVTLREHAPDADDRAVLAHTRRLSRWLLTLDGDFGELIFRHGEAPPPAIPYFRLHPIVVEQLPALALRALTAGIGSGLVVVTAAGERQRPFNQASGGGSG